jgi:hypothetical protein
MTKKIKFFDSICFSGDVEFLKFRLTELDPHVDYFIIADFTSDDSNLSFLKNKNLFDKWNYKISHVFVDNDSFLSKIKNEFINLNPYFEDILMISNVNELPNLNYKNEILDKIIFEPLVLKHQNFIWNINYIDGNFSKGTLIFSFSDILKYKNILNNVFEQKFKINSNLYTLHQNGWIFLNFGDYDPNYETNIKELLPPDEIDPVRTYPLIKHNNEIELPNNINLLPYFKIGRYNVKRHLFLVESDLEFVNQNYYDTITIIDFDSNLKEVLCEKVSEKITKSVLYLPNVVLYGDPETFQNEYIMNETKRMFSVVFPQEEDVIEVIIRNEKPLVLGGVSN